ncbi:hypothetical protein CIK05_02985 [Bdellovibrio sp. qaytius]|nr:hypothetical protein CIK05_02985 [Bdellovibrio sp. qaytius]
MQIGLHFGKRKPRWNFFLEKHQGLKQRHGATLKYALIGLALQAIVLSPLLYWSLQNYSFFENNIPLSYNLRTYLESERHWIMLLFGACTLMTGVVNFVLFSRVLTREALEYANVIELSPDEAADQRHVS